MISSPSISNMSSLTSRSTNKGKSENHRISLEFKLIELVFMNSKKMNDSDMIPEFKLEFKRGKFLSKTKTYKLTRDEKTNNMYSIKFTEKTISHSSTFKYYVQSKSYRDKFAEFRLLK